MPDKTINGMPTPPGNPENIPAGTQIPNAPDDPASLNGSPQTIPTPTPQRLPPKNSNDTRTLEPKGVQDKAPGNMRMNSSQAAIRETSDAQPPQQTVIPQDYSQKVEPDSALESYVPETDAEALLNKNSIESAAPEVALEAKLDHILEEAARNNRPASIQDIGNIDPARVVPEPITPEEHNNLDTSSAAIAKLRIAPSAREEMQDTAHATASDSVSDKPVERAQVITMNIPDTTASNHQSSAGNFKIVEKDSLHPAQPSRDQGFDSPKILAMDITKTMAPEQESSNYALTHTSEINRAMLIDHEEAGYAIATAFGVKHNPPAKKEAPGYAVATASNLRIPAFQGEPCNYQSSFDPSKQTENCSSLDLINSESAQSSKIRYQNQEHDALKRRSSSISEQ